MRLGLSLRGLEKVTIDNQDILPAVHNGDRRYGNLPPRNIENLKRSSLDIIMEEHNSNPPLQWPEMITLLTNNYPTNLNLTSQNDVTTTPSRIQ